MKSATRATLVQRYVDNLHEGLITGHNLIDLLESLDGKVKPRTNIRLRSGMIQILRASLDLLEDDGRTDVIDCCAEDNVHGHLTPSIGIIRKLIQQLQKKWNLSYENAAAKCVDRNIGERSKTDTTTMNRSGLLTLPPESVSSTTGQLSYSAIRNEYAKIYSSDSEKTDVILSFWRERMESIIPLKLPYEKRDNKAEPKWETTAWSQPILDTRVGDAPRVLLDAFVIYLARLVNETTLHIGCGIRNVTDGKGSVSVKPMIVNVSFQEPWSSVSKSVDHELALLTWNCRIPSKSAPKEATGTMLPWRIVVRMEDASRMDIKDTSTDGRVLTLRIDNCGWFRWVYDARTLSSDVVERMDEHLKELAKAVSSETYHDTPICNLNMLPDAERKLLLEDWNHVEVKPTSQSCLHHLFSRQVLATPEATALIHEAEIVTYAELNERANQLARKLIKLGVVPDQVVAVCVSISPAMVVGILGVLKAGGACLPLNHSEPSLRLLDCLNEASPKIMIADDLQCSALMGIDLSGITVIPANGWHTEPVSDPEVSDLSSTNLAYVFYTSGTTGRPKGVMIEHRNMVRLFDVSKSVFDVTRNDVWCMLHSIGFAYTLWEFWAPLVYGGKLVLVSWENSRSIDYKRQLIREHGVTVLTQTPTAFGALISRYGGDAITARLRYVILSAEPLDTNILRPLYAAEGKKLPTFVNVYGTTETHWAFTKTIDEADIPSSERQIGFALSDTAVYLLDPYGQPVPCGAIGELYIRSGGVVRGYHGRPDLNRKCFLPDPFSKVQGSRMYKTGDLAKYLPNGSLVILGRNDRQIRVRGFRIEAGEIESRLREHYAIRDAFVFALGEEPDKRLVSYVVADAIDDLSQKLYLHLSDRLPAYMIPVAFVRVEEFPITANGKLDTRALPPVDTVSLVRRSYEPPMDGTESLLARIWEKLLGFERVGRNDSFFALGGHSLVAMRLIVDMKSYGLGITIRNLFQYPVLSDLARTVTTLDTFIVPKNVLTPTCNQLTPKMLPLIDLKQSDIDEIVSRVPGGLANIQDIYELSPMQDGILFHHLLLDEGDPYTMTRILAFQNMDTLNGYLTAFQSVIDRHDIMRTAFFWRGLSVPVQVVCRRVQLLNTRLELDPAGGPVIEQLRNRYGSHRYRIDLSESPLVRAVITREPDGKWLLLIVIHHLICDERTITVMDAEISAHMEGRGSDLYTSYPFRNHIARIRRSLNDDNHTRFFTDMLHDVTDGILSFGLVAMRDTYARIEPVRETLESNFTRKLRLATRALDVSPATLCHLAWALVVSRTSGAMRTVFGTVLSGRTLAGEGSRFGLGIFINMLPVKLDIDETSVRESVHRTQKLLAQLLEYEQASLVLAQRCSSVSDESPLFNSLINYDHHQSTKEITTSERPFEVLRFEGQTHYPLLLSVDDDDVSLDLGVQVFEPVEPSRVCSYMREALKNLITALDVSPHAPVRLIDVLPTDERAMLLRTASGSDPSDTDLTCLHHYFEKQVTLRPSSIALVGIDETLTYAELNTRANRLAHHLVDLGVVPDRLVGICVSVSVSMIIGVLAILKAGGAYVPLDPEHPEQRLRDVMTDAALDIVIVDEMGLQRLGGSSGSQPPATTIFVTPEMQFPRVENTSNPVVSELRAENLAYVIYTSGSTGGPKGVMIEHRNVAKLFESTELLYGFSHLDVWPLMHSLAFDVSVWEIWGALRYGGQLVLISRDNVRSPKATHRILSENKVTVLNQTPSAFKAHIDTYLEREFPESLRYVIFAGESLDPRVLQPLYFASGGTCPRFINMYGLTEVTVHATSKELHLKDTSQSSSLIGVGLRGVRMYLLDAQGRPVPFGAVGELHVGGGSIARGYLNRPDLTKKRFLVDEYNGGRMYKTGDLAQYLPNGDLVFLGRNDDQIKVRGFRIEPRDIEDCLSTLPTVHQAVVITYDVAGEKSLVAYVVSEARDDLANSLRSHVASKLPDYMIPSRFVRLDSLPLTCNGKLDKKALPVPGDLSLARNEYESPITDVECMVASIWGQLLNIERISRNDNFFALGGHSILAVRMVNLAADRCLVCTLNDIFQYPVLGDFISKITSDPRTRRLHVAIPVRLTGTEAPLFFTPTGSGDFSYTYAFSEFIRTSCPIYILPWPPLRDGEVSTLKEFAVKMIPLIKAVQNEGPYRLCGYSSGGLLCHAIADILEDQGESIGFLGVIDSPLFDIASEESQWRREIISRILVVSAGTERQNDIAILSKQIGTLSTIEFVEAAKKMKIFPSNLSTEIYAQQLQNGLNFFKLISVYIPRALNVTIHQFNATDEVETDIFIDKFFAGPTFNLSKDWADRFPNIRRKIIPMQGSHISIMNNPEHKSILGQAINEAIPAQTILPATKTTIGKGIVADCGVRDWELL